MLANDNNLGVLIQKKMTYLLLRGFFFFFFDIIY